MWPVSAEVFSDAGEGLLDPEGTEAGIGSLPGLGLHRLLPLRQEQSTHIKPGPDCKQAGNMAEPVRAGGKRLTR